MSAIDRRKNPRVSADAPVVVVMTQGESFRGRMRDLCRDAALIECPPQPTGTEVTVALELPGPGGTVSVAGNVVRVTHDAMAVLFSAVDPEAEVRIQGYLASLQG